MISVLMGPVNNDVWSIKRIIKQNKKAKGRSFILFFFIQNKYEIE